MARTQFQMVLLVLSSSLTMQLVLAKGRQGLKIPPRPLVESKVDKRAFCPEGGGDKDSGCSYWKKLGFCDPSKGYGDFMEETCRSSCGFCQARPTVAPKAFAVNVNQKKCLQAHNSKRALHGAVPLVWDDSLAQDALKWALHLANANTFEHAPWDGQGENLYYVSRFGGGGKLGTCEEALQAWYDEVNDYPFGNPPNSIFDVKGKQIGHFTQVVWKSTRKLGVGIAAIKRGSWTKTYVVARYTPPGNYEGRLAQQVGDLNVAGF